MTTTAEAKAALRAQVLRRRAELGPPALGSAARALRDVLLGTPELRAARRVAAYVSVGREPGTGPLVDALRAADVDVLLPLLDPASGDLEWAEYAGPDALGPAPRGLLEPTTPSLGTAAVLDADVVLVPGLAADSRGRRLGRGGGSYDRVLARVRAARRPPWTCALLHDGELLDLPVPVEAHDVPVAAAALPSGLHRFGLGGRHGGRQ